MTRTFIMTKEFDKNWKTMNLTDSDLKALQEELILNPTKGDLMQGTGGLRKLRIAFEGKGKSGSGRVCYVDFAVFDKIYLITAYPKNEKDNLSKAERNAIANMIAQLEKSLKG
ncbi:MAG: type II toxin-antitoxin system RelE/ParE family toxin [Oscillospiraceae bacterium]|nr:type II toxin-antitoxin system RelE/ParE family toxin [Oscillospiraceae bacterium]MBR3537122.1 type II toxin-antitoxin system RelE/ParE family toxin [Oscillospiraceae bacterium]MBR6836897.1 type II toxin-antitoxin system RelE/ParE family toxin [Oscillospiraceae bacterium]